ncbi:uncharacterized protein LOC110451158 [Mizuhopecten yessoensis]|uniref:uncharacterized protein LOC110451158 n=1 Tax=Mizuhopecten yessoensis TaxID=6573 RepID=UPI000B45E650|nr:uncharacterized protein LOC110451158 [Mizuhopecten yessoensis]
MTNKLMAGMNLHGKCGKRAFSKTHQFKLICETVINSYDTTTTKVMQEMSKFLKYAPERLGGGGRKKEVIP